MCIIKYSIFFLQNKLFDPKVIMQGKLIAVAYTLRTYLNQFWAEFVNKKTCISVRLVSEEDKAFNFDDFDN